ncbi:MAG: hypothetical protein AB7T09_37280 [Planctomycetota bacterium]
MTLDRAISLRDLLFVRDVLIPRAWVQGPEVDELIALRARIDGIVAGLREPSPVEQQSEATPASPEKPGMKPRSPS